VFLRPEGSWTLEERDCQRGNLPKFIQSRRNRGLEVIPEIFSDFPFPRIGFSTFSEAILLGNCCNLRIY
jgi:hypothetical protein